jgi:hypothetical protein
MHPSRDLLIDMETTVTCDINFSRLFPFLTGCAFPWLLVK